MTKRSIILCILDGWGHSTTKQNNAIAAANLKFYNKILSKYPNALIKTSGNAVGLPKNQMGNSEVGHMTIGSGRIVLQDLQRLNQITNNANQFFSNDAIKNLLNKLNIENTCHLIGLISDGGVHSHINHIINCAKLLKSKGIKIKLHAISDGRDTSPNTVKSYLKKLYDNNIEIATLSGRYYAMDRDNRWERIQKAYEAIVYGKGYKCDNFNDYIDSQYKIGITDEFLPPIVSNNYYGINDGDALFAINFRADRMRQLMYSFVNKNFNFFPRKKVMLSYILSTVEYCNSLKEKVDTILEPININNYLSETLSKNSKTQLKLAETEKYAHVTYFFNAGQEIKLEGEDWILIPSPKVDTYDQCPEMSAKQITNELVQSIKSEKYDFICVNYANADMVGHTGNFQATKEACQFLDKCLSEITEAALKNNSEIIITADHGNAEEMFDNSKMLPKTSHTLNAVPIVYIGGKNIQLNNGELSDIAPTILDLINIQKPKEMSGKSLIVKNSETKNI